MHRLGLLKYLKKLFEEASGLEHTAEIASGQILLSPKNSDRVIMVRLKDLQVINVHSSKNPMIFNLDISDHAKALRTMQAVFNDK